VTAVITGGTSGIGLAFAEALSALGESLVLVARSREELATVAAGLSRATGVQVDTLAADLSGPAGQAQVSERLRDDDVTLLVNSAGYGTYGAFLEQDPDYDTGQVDVNVTAVVALSHAALPGMVARGNGSIVNVSSTAAGQPMPFQAVYGATKAFVTSFSYALADEVADSGITVMALHPGYTLSRFHDRAGVSRSSVPSWLWLEPEAVVRQALTDLKKGRRSSTPGLANRVLLASAQMSPPRLSARVSTVLTKRFRP